MLYDNFICSFLNLNHLKSITSWDDLASHDMIFAALLVQSARPRQQRSLDTSLTSWQKQRARRQDLGTVDCGGLDKSGTTSLLSGFADRNVQGLHPVVQRCCPQLCAYGPYGYDALQHVMPSNETHSSCHLKMHLKCTPSVNEARREPFCTALNRFSEDCGGLMCNGVFQM